MNRHDCIVRGVLPAKQRPSFRVCNQLLKVLQLLLQISLNILALSQQLFEGFNVLDRPAASTGQLQIVLELPAGSE